MKAKGKVVFRYKDSGTAKILARLLEIDNKIAPRKLKIKTGNKDNLVMTQLEHEKLNTFFATIDDLLFSEKLINGLIEG